MARAIHQFRFYSDDEKEPRNCPSGLEYNQVGGMKAFSTGSLFDASNNANAKKYIPILQLGIQTIPGTYFYLNGGVDPIIIGSTGIYELDLSGDVEISKLEFDLASLQRINEMQNGYLIIDIVYDDQSELEEGGVV
nr:MAG TPA: hypothetical protein [Caudoviricetes sp.]